MPGEKKESLLTPQILPNMRHVIEIVLGIFTASSSMGSIPEQGTKREKADSPKISSLPRTKDTWGLFDKAHFKETPHASALPAVH